MSHPIEITLFGAPQLRLDGKPVRLRRRKSVAILAYLALAEYPRTREHLATLLWPETDSSHAHGSLRIALHDISTVADVLTTGGDNVSLSTEGCKVDVLRFLEI